jgi:hypothetical protein
MSGTSKNDGVSYEMLTEAVFSRLKSLTSIGATVQRDVQISGKSGATYQIDLVVDIPSEVLPFKALVQCKDWGNRVKREQVMAFHSVLNDVAGQPRGIFVTRSGFQAGAVEYGRHHGIELYELRAPKDEDWEGLVRSVELTMSLRAPRFENVRIVPDDEWVRSQLLERGLPVIPIKEDVRLHVGSTVMRYESGEPFDVNALLNSYVTHESPASFSITHQFNENGVIVTLDGRRIPQLRGRALTADVRLEFHEETMSWSLDHLVAYCFRDVIGGKIRFLGIDGGDLKPA